MSIEVKIQANFDQVSQTIEARKKIALTAMGIKAVNLILYKMRQGYGKPIRQTGDLQRDVTYEINESNDSVEVGNTLEYAPFVHDGHAGHSVYIKDVGWRVLPGGHTPGRPYIRDALTGNDAAEKLRKVAEAYFAETE